MFLKKIIWYDEETRDIEQTLAECCASVFYVQPPLFRRLVAAGMVGASQTGCLEHWDLHDKELGVM